MPGPYIHISAMWNSAADLAAGDYRPPESSRINPTWTGPAAEELARLLNENSNYAAIGAVGPDLFFFLPDFRDVDGIKISSVLVGVIAFLEEAYEFLDEHFLTKWEHYLGPISEDQAEEMSRLTGGLSDSVSNITGELSGLLVTLLEDFFVSQRDWWEFFSLGLNKGYDEQAYFWSDMLHYRKTGEFGRALWQIANETDDSGAPTELNTDGAKAYALGYMSHLATDVTGHAFVNQIAGGPFRTHWQRHHLVENHMDCAWYLSDPRTPAMGDRYPQLTESALYYDIAFSEADGKAPVARPAYPTGNTLRENWVRRRQLDVDSDLGEPVAALLIEAMERVFYQDGEHPKILATDGKPTEDEVNEAFKLFFRYLKLSMLDGFDHEVPPPPEVFPNLSPPTIEDPSSEPPGEDDDDSFWDDLLDFLLSVIAVILFIAEWVAYILTLPWAIIADLVTYPLRLFLYYALELPLFMLVKHFRMVLVMTGYMHPMSDEIAPSLVTVGASNAQAFRDMLGQVDDVAGGALEGLPDRDEKGSYRDRLYPRQHPDDEFHHPWDYPLTPVERNPTTAGPHARSASPGDLFVHRDSDPAVRDRLEGAESPSQADVIGQLVQPSRNLGDSVGFSKYLIWLLTRDPKQEGGEVPIVDWNLDADRGYGYHCWDWDRWAESSGRTHPDPEGNDFREPCTPPPQSDFETWDESRVLKVHWKDQPDPGCEGAPGKDAPKLKPDPSKAPTQVHDEPPEPPR